jgi:hypothetical protein
VLFRSLEGIGLPPRDLDPLGGGDQGQGQAPVLQPHGPLDTVDAHLREVRPRRQPNGVFAPLAAAQGERQGRVCQSSAGDQPVAALVQG